MKKKPTPKRERVSSFKRDQSRTFIAILAFALGIFAGYLIWGTSSTPTEALAPAETAPQDAPDALLVQRKEISIEGYPSIGPKDAPITIVEFSDFGCSFCAKWHNETFEELMATYPDQIRFVYRDVPFRAFPASEAAQCAREQDSFWEYHDKLFSYEYGLTDEAYLQYARDLNLDMDAFTACLSDHRYQEKVQRDLDYATELGVNSTPTFYINGIPLIGAHPLETFKQAIDKELANAN